MGVGEIIELAGSNVNTAILCLGVWILYQMQKSIKELNVNVGILLERDAAKTRDIDDHEVRIRSIERVVAR